MQFCGVMKPIFLIGYMCCGKTTLGEAVAEMASLRFVDLDCAIEAEAGMSVKDIFSTHGQEYFRRLEREALERVSLMPDTVVACGGGTACSDANMELMNRRGLTVWLEASLERTLTRLDIFRGNRPLTDALYGAELEAFVREAFDGRRHYYARCRERFCSDMLETPEQVQRSAREFVNQFIITHL